jgi:hypothetical protein
MAKEQPTKEPTLTAPPAETPPPGGGGLTADIYAEDRKATEDAQKEADAAAAKYLNVEAAQHSEEVRSAEADEAAQAAQEEADARKQAASEATAAATEGASKDD